MAPTLTSFSIRLRDDSPPMLDQPCPGLRKTEASSVNVTRRTPPKAVAAGRRKHRE